MRLLQGSARRLWLLAAWLLFAGGCSYQSQPQLADRAAPSDPRALPMQYADCNVVLISLDALQAAHVGCLGNARNVTPHLDAFSRESFTFTQATSVASWTVPASMTWFTGVYPSEHGMTNKFAIYNAVTQKRANLQEISPNLVTLAQFLKARGYATGGFTGNAGVSGGFGYGQGFDTYYFEPNKFGGLEESVPRALAWLKQHRNEKFFLFLHGYDCHGQRMPPAGYDYRFVERGYDRKFTGAPSEQELLREEGLANGHVTMRDQDVLFWRAIYDEKIARADERFRYFWREFQKLGLMDKTLFIVTSDHGTEFHEHGRFDHGFTLYQEQIHVPLFIRLPGQRTGCRVDERISSIDLLPTIIELLDLPPDELAGQPRGVSLVSNLQGQGKPREILAETDYREYTFQRALISPAGWKLIYKLESRTRELFDLNQDPAEQKNLAAEQPELADELQERLFQSFADLGHDLKARRWEPGLNPVYDSQANPATKH